MVIELKDCADVVVHNKFHRWRKRNPRGMFLSLVNKTTANLHGVPCHHAGTHKWHPGDPSSLTKKLKVLEDGPGSLQQWASERNISIHMCNDCRSNGYIIGHFDEAAGPEKSPSEDTAPRTDRALSKVSKVESTFLLAWNPERFDWEDLQEDIADIRKKGFVTRRWSCGNRKDLPKGSEIFLIRLGTEPKGIVGRGIAVSKATEGSHWDAEKRREKIKGWNVDVRITELSERPIVPWDVLQKPPLSSFRWSIQASGIRVPEGVAGALRSCWVSGITNSAKTGAEASHSKANPLQRTLEELRTAAYAAVKTPGLNQKTSDAKRSWYERSAIVRDYVLARANGVCEACDEKAPFLKKNGRPYLEPHHTHRLADEGPDHPTWVGAICPTCHRRIHSGQDGAAWNSRLKARLQK